MQIEKRTVKHGPLNIGLMNVKGDCRDVADADKLQEELQAFRASGVIHVILDASQMTHVISAVIGRLVYLGTLLHDEGGEFYIVNPHEKFRSELVITRLDKFFGVYETREEAIKSLLRS